MQTKKKNQNAQSEQTKTFTALLPVNLSAQMRVVDALDKADVREACPPAGGLAAQTPFRFRECYGNGGHRFLGARG
jgi:hypothetical protein